MCGEDEEGERNRQEGWAGEQSGDENTCDGDSESHRNPWSRAGARETCSHDGNTTGQEREVEAVRQGEKAKGDGQHCTPKEPQSGWKHGVWVKAAQGVRGVEWQRHGPCDGPHLAEPRVGG